jgi:hypothetical protein
MRFWDSAARGPATDLGELGLPAIDIHKPLAPLRPSHNKWRLDINKAVEWPVASKELRFPKQTDGKRMVKEWRAAQRALVR